MASGDEEVFQRRLINFMVKRKNAIVISADDEATCAEAVENCCESGSGDSGPIETGYSCETAYGPLESGVEYTFIGSYTDGDQWIKLGVVESGDTCCIRTEGLCGVPGEDAGQDVYTGDCGEGGPTYVSGSQGPGSGQACPYPHFGDEIRYRSPFLSGAFPLTVWLRVLLANSGANKVDHIYKVTWTLNATVCPD